MAMIDTTCPVCGASHARKLSLIFEEGRSSMQGGFESVGKTNTIGQVKITTHGTSYGIQQSDASRSAAPPSIPPIRAAARTKGVLLIFGSPFLGLVFALAGGMGFFNGMGLVLALTFAGFVLGLMSGDQPTADEIASHRVKHSALYAELAVWEQTFACGSCGHRFVPDASEKQIGKTAAA